MLRAWAIEGTSGHGAGLARHLAHREELVVELDRPERAKRRNGATSDPLDAIRAAREALAATEYVDGYCSVTGDPARHMIAARKSEESCDPMCVSCRLAALHRPAEGA
jgi:hypothetical protein